MNAHEEWRPAPGFEGRYAVSSHGHVMSIGTRRRPQMLKPKLWRGGYLAVGLYGADGRRRFIYIHRLVLEAFAGRRPEGQECRHLNGDPTDNRWPDNICWGTPSENMADRVRHGTSNRGERNGRSKLTQSDVAEIRARHSAGVAQQNLAVQFGVSRSLISYVTSGRYWRHGHE